MSKINLLFVLFVFGLLACNKPVNVREVKNIDANWQFVKADSAFDGSMVALADSAWQNIDLPHDWAITDSVKKNNPSGDSGGYFGGGIGWYRKQLFIPTAYNNKNVTITFDGVYMQYDLYVNGQKVGSQSNGYITRFFDVSKFVKPGQNNVIALRVDNSVQPFDRWYTGCGIYRHVWLTVTNKVHIPVWGTYVTTPVVTVNWAMVNLQIAINNTTTADTLVKVVTKIVAPGGNVIATNEADIKLHSEATDTLTQLIKVNEPLLWSTSTPNLYKAISRVYIAGFEVDSYETLFGIRTVAFSRDSGFMLNNQKVILKGVCLHHDLGGVGAAFHDKIMLRRLQLLKQMGCNAIRLSHNPYAPQVLDMCDSLGLLVFNEAFDRWEARVDRGHSKAVSFKNSWRDDLGRFVERDRNHPSVFIWSVGNETYEQQIKAPRGIEIIKELVAFVHAKDSSRKVTSAMHPGFLKDPEQFDISNYNDVASYNYATRMFAGWRKSDTSKIYLSSETKPYTDYGQLQLGENPDFSGNSWFNLQAPDCGQFIWTGIDYFGESPGWPFRGFPWSPINTCGYVKGYGGFTQSLYSSKPVVQIAVFDKQLSDSLTHYQSWSKIWAGPPFAAHWNPLLQPGDSVSLLTFTNCQTVQLMLNNSIIGEKSVSDFPDKVIRWKIPYKPGVIKAIAKNNGVEKCQHQLQTSATANQIKLMSVDSKISANDLEIAIIDVFIADSLGITCPHATNNVDFNISGPGYLVAVDNGDLSQHFIFNSNSIVANSGRCQLMVRASGEKGNIVINATSKGLSAGQYTVEVQ